MEVKYVATIDFTSLHALKTFIRIVNEAGGSVSISGERPDKISRLDNLIIEAETVFSSDIKIYASSALDVERVRTDLNCEIGSGLQKSAACTLLESVTNFRGVRQEGEVRSS
ncbi:MAG TPA: hypothetical protein VFC58_08670 [Desulfosporosinus sp.]|nr:hypothetical protein [Desulfosporosinus sp.]